nr:gamma interferon inducible lysosomal thiol reductase [Colletotrichum truncatum]KAF6784945.1 gamma interferon inducible lysosomal thiol reductase [Colletotrichum truncatum]
MDVKLGYYNTPPNMSGRLAYRKKSLWPLSLLGIYLIYTIWGYTRLPHAPRFVPQQAPVVAEEKKLVPLEAHIMSKCPDARDCLRDLVLPTMMKTHNKVNFTLSFIGTPTENDGIACKHGPSECMGNILELCAAHLYPDPKINLGFTMCLTREYQAIPERSLVEDCALEHAIDIKELNDCATQDGDAPGLGLLRDSVRRSTDVSLVLHPNRLLCYFQGQTSY